MIISINNDDRLTNCNLLLILKFCINFISRKKNIDEFF